MCAIAGWLDSSIDLREKTKTIENMQNSLVRRGPDENGIFLDKNICLMHQRLAVVDLENGKQPMLAHFQDEEFILVYNGEIYNTESIRKELAEKGYKFFGHSDTEVLLKSFIEWKEKSLEKLNGIFAFAIFSKKQNKLFLARDRIGVKPLFFFEYKDGIIFASEIKALLQNPKVKPIINQQGLKELFLVGPGRTPGNGVIKGVQEVLPGEYLEYYEGKFRRHKYWALKAYEFEDDINTAKEKTKFLLEQSITSQLISDVPLCCLLSGGLDSSIICKIASDFYKKERNEQLNTYSVDYIDNDKFFQKNLFQPNSDDEYIKIMSDFIDSKHHKIILNNKDLVPALKEALIARDLPGMADIDSSLLLFAREIKKDFTVGLSGECADEIFGGYPWYHNEEILWQKGFPWAKSLDLRLSILNSNVLKNSQEYINTRYKDTINATPTLPSDTPLEKRMKEMFMLNINWFMQTLLDRKDRMTMYNGLEVRVPFCDYRLLEYAFNMPWSIKSYKGREKGILREVMSDILPQKIVWRKKSPYPKTHNPIYLELVSKSLKRILQKKNSPLNQILNTKKINELLENPENLNLPWYGQLMQTPQLFAYLIQMDFWFEEYGIKIEI